MALRDTTINIAEALPLVRGQGGNVRVELEESIIDEQYARYRALNGHLHTCIAPRLHHAARPKFERELALFGSCVVLSSFEHSTDVVELRANFRRRIDTSATSLCAIINAVPDERHIMSQ